MAKFRVGDGQTTSTLPQPVSPARTQQVKGKPAVAKTTICQATKIKYDSHRLKTGRIVSRGMAQCNVPRNALARKPYAIAFV